MLYFFLKRVELFFAHLLFVAMATVFSATAENYERMFQWTKGMNVSIKDPSCKFKKNYQETGITFSGIIITVISSLFPNMATLI